MRVKSSSIHHLRALLVLAAMLLLTSCGDPNAVLAAKPVTVTSQMWVGAWEATGETANPSGSNTGSDQSFRFIVSPTIDGTQERIHLSNRLSKTPVTIGAARLSAAVGVGPAIDPTRDVPLTFSGSTSVTIAAGAEVVSDPVNITYAYGENLAVSVYFKGSFGPLTQHNSEFQLNFQSDAAAGDVTKDVSGASMHTTTSLWLALTGVDVYGAYQGSVAVFGSSSVDGHASNYGDTNSYPTANTAVPGQNNDRPSDWLARQLLAAGYRMGVLNAGAIGDPAAEDNTTAAGTSIAGVDRMQHDVLQQAGIKAVVIYFGGIDIRSDCKQATDVEASLTNMVQQAQAVGVRVILATLPPSEFCTSASPVPGPSNPYAGDVDSPPENPGSTQRRALNDWIRSSGAALPGVVAIADFDKALADPAHPDFMIAKYNSGDNFHPNGAGYGIQSSAIPLSAILGQ